MVSNSSSTASFQPDNTSVLPNHVAIIMDGNGRWAKARKKPRVFGHRAGVDAVKRIVEECIKLNISTLTLFAFSSENWGRPADEVSRLMQLFQTILERESTKLHEQNICLRFIGDRARFSQKLQQNIAKAEYLTEKNTGLALNVAANYGGKWDIVNAANRVISDVLSKKLAYTEEGINEAVFSQYLSLAALPEPDLFIRTGGERRISNFLLWQLAYCELYFCDTLWPDFSSQEFDQAINDFQARQRRFGLTSEQVFDKEKTC